MTRLIVFLSVLSFALWVSVGMAQQVAEAEPTEVRFVHASPNAVIEDFVVLDADGEPAIDRAAIGDLAYLDATPFMSIAEGTYTFRVRLADVDDAPSEEVTLPQTLNVVAGNSYTVAIIGLVVPEVFEDPSEGFLAWLQDLFTADHEEPALQAMIFDGVRTTPVPGDEVDVRIAHVATGTEPVDLVIDHANDTSGVLGTVSYTEVSGYNTMRPEAGTLQVRIAGSDVVVTEISEEEVAPGARYTIMLTGTPIEDVPLEVLVLADGG